MQINRLFRQNHLTIRAEDLVERRPSITILLLSQNRFQVSHSNYFHFPENYRYFIPIAKNRPEQKIYWY